MEYISHDTMKSRQNLIGGKFCRLKTIESGCFTTGMSITRSRSRIQTGANTAHSGLTLAFDAQEKGPRNPDVLAQCSTTLESARHSHSRKRHVDRTSLNQCGKKTPMQEQQRMELVPIHETGPELRTIQYWPACINSPIERPRHCHRREANLTQPHHRPEFKPRPLRFSMHSTLSGASVILQHWMERQGRGHASHLPEVSQLQLSTPGQLLEPTEI